MNLINIGSNKYTGPANWNDITREQLIAWIKICAKSIGGENALKLAMMVFYKIPPKVFFRLNSAQQIQLIDVLTFLGTGNHLVKWLIPKIKVSYMTLLGPVDRLTNSSIKEFRFSELYYNAYLVSKDPRALDMLITTLYRPTGKQHPDNDLRIPVTEIDIQLRAKYVSGLDPVLRGAILFNYEGCRSFIFTRYPTVFKPGGTSVSKDLPDLEGLIKTVAGGKFGPFKETETTPLYLFLDHLSDEIEQAEKIKRK